MASSGAGSIALQRLRNATLTTDKLDVLREMQRDVRPFIAASAAAVPLLLSFLRASGRDAVLLPPALQVLIEMLSVEDAADEPASLILSDDAAMRLILALLRTPPHAAGHVEGDIHLSPHLLAVQLLTALLYAARDATNACITRIPSALADVAALLDAADAASPHDAASVNDALTLLGACADVNAQLRDLVAFQDGYDRLFSLIAAALEGDAHPHARNVRVYDCMRLVHVCVAKGSAVSKRLFLQCSRIPTLAHVLTLPFDETMTATRTASDTLSLARTCAWYAAATIVCALDGVADGEDFTTPQAGGPREDSTPTDTYAQVTTHVVAHARSQLYTYVLAPLAAIATASPHMLKHAAEPPHAHDSATLDCVQAVAWRAAAVCVCGNVDAAASVGQQLVLTHEFQHAVWGAGQPRAKTWRDVLHAQQDAPTCITTLATAAVDAIACAAPTVSAAAAVFMLAYVATGPATAASLCAHVTAPPPVDVPQELLALVHSHMSSLPPADTADARATLEELFQSYLACVRETACTPVPAMTLATSLLLHTARRCAAARADDETVRTLSSLSSLLQTVCADGVCAAIMTRVHSGMLLHCDDEAAVGSTAWLSLLSQTCEASVAAVWDASAPAGDAVSPPLLALAACTHVCVRVMRVSSAAVSLLLDDGMFMYACDALTHRTTASSCNDHILARGMCAFLLAAALNHAEGEAWPPSRVLDMIRSRMRFTHLRTCMVAALEMVGATNVARQHASFVAAVSGTHSRVSVCDAALARMYMEVMDAHVHAAARVYEGASNDGGGEDAKAQLEAAQATIASLQTARAAAEADAAALAHVYEDARAQLEAKDEQLASMSVTCAALRADVEALMDGDATAGASRRSENESVLTAHRELAGVCEELARRAGEPAPSPDTANAEAVLRYVDVLQRRAGGGNDVSGATVQSLRAALATALAATHAAQQHAQERSHTLAHVRKRARDVCERLSSRVAQLTRDCEDMALLVAVRDEEVQALVHVCEAHGVGHEAMRVRQACMRTLARMAGEDVPSDDEGARDTQALRQQEGLHAPIGAHLPSMLLRPAGTSPSSDIRPLLSLPSNQASPLAGSGAAVALSARAPALSPSTRTPSQRVMPLGAPSSSSSPPATGYALSLSPHARSQGSSAGAAVVHGHDDGAVGFVPSAATPTSSRSIEAGRGTHAQLYQDAAGASAEHGTGGAPALVSVAAFFGDSTMDAPAVQQLHDVYLRPVTRSDSARTAGSGGGAQTDVSDRFTDVSLDTNHHIGGEDGDDHMGMHATSDSMEQHAGWGMLSSGFNGRPRHSDELRGAGVLSPGASSFTEVKLTPQMYEAGTVAVEQEEACRGPDGVRSNVGSLWQAFGLGSGDMSPADASNEAVMLSRSVEEHEDSEDREAGTGSTSFALTGLMSSFVKTLSSSLTSGIAGGAALRGGSASPREVEDEGGHASENAGLMRQIDVHGMSQHRAALADGPPTWGPSAAWGSRTSEGAGDGSNTRATALPVLSAPPVMVAAGLMSATPDIGATTSPPQAFGVVPTRAAPGSHRGRIHRPMYAAPPQ